MIKRQNFYRLFRSHSRGVGLIEVIIAVGLLSLVVIALLSALSTASKATFIADERATAESLARTQMEDIKEQGYRKAPINDEVIYDKMDEDDIPGGYTIWSVNRADATVEDVIGVPWDTLLNQPSATDDGIQKITLKVKHHDKEVITLEDYKVNR